MFQLSSKVAGEHGPVSPPSQGASFRPITLIQNLGHLPPVSGNSITFLSDYDASIDALVAEIDRAQNHVHLLYFIFADDESGQKVMAALARATQRGVTCRVLLDAAGSRPWAHSVVETLSRSGVAVHRVLALGLRGYTRADLRNHRKIAVVDGRFGYIGSQNIVDADFKPGIVNQELVARAAGPVVRELQAVFARDWFTETEQVLEGPAFFPESDGCRADSRASAAERAGLPRSWDRAPHRRSRSWGTRTGCDYDPLLRSG